MALNPSFTITQTLSNPTSAYLVDTSTGSNAAYTERRVSLKDWKGNYLKPSGTTTDYFVWDKLSFTKLIDALTKDYCLLVTVKWVNAGGTALYTSEKLVLFTLYSENALFLATQRQVITNGIVTDITFYEAKKKVRLEVDGAINAFENEDIASAQNSLDRAAKLIPLIANPNTFIMANPSPTATQYTASWWWGNTDPYTALQTADALVYLGTGSFLSGSPIVADVHSAPINQYFVFKEPASEASKILWSESAFNNGSIPDSVFRTPFVAGEYRYYVTRNLTTFSNSASARVSLTA